MERRRFTREFKVEAVKLVRERGVAVRQAARDLIVQESVPARERAIRGAARVGATPARAWAAPGGRGAAARRRRSDRAGPLFGGPRPHPPMDCRLHLYLESRR